MDSLVTSSPDILGGMPVIAGTRVPVQTLFEYLQAGESINSFLEGFASVKREQVLRLLDEAQSHLVQAAH